MSGVGLTAVDDHLVVLKKEGSGGAGALSPNIVNILCATLAVLGVRFRYPPGFRFNMPEGFDEVAFEKRRDVCQRTRLCLPLTCLSQ